jgi:ribonuclease HII
MRECVAQLEPRPEALLIDAVRLPELGVTQRSMNKGDLVSLAIASASILAKVTRDRIMIALAETYPGYGLAQHKGYGTARHRQALHALGPTRIHRRSFAPVAAERARRSRSPSPGAD